MRILALTLIAACSYSEPVGSSLLTTDAGDDAGPADSSASAAVFQGQVDFVTVFDDDVWFLNNADSGNSAERVLWLSHVVDRTGERVAPLPDASHFPFGMTQDADHVYWSAQLVDEAAGVYPEWGIQALDKTTHATSTVLAHFPNPIGALAVADGRVYFLSKPDGTLPELLASLMMMPVTGGMPVEVIDHMSDPTAVRYDDDYVYAVDQRYHQIRAVSRATPHAGSLVVYQGDSPFDVEPHGDWLYVTDGGRVTRVPRPAPHAQQADLDPAPQLLSDGFIEGFNLVVRNDDIYVGAYFEGLLRAPIVGGAPEILNSNGIQGYGMLVQRSQGLLYTHRAADNTAGGLYDLVLP